MAKWSYAMIFNRLNVEQVLQALSYLQNKTNDENYMKLIKLIFFSDRYHIRHYGTLMTHDKYIAMPFGSVCSNILNIVTKNEEYLTEFSKEEIELVNKCIKSVSPKDIKVDFFGTNKLSTSAIESLEFSIEHFGKFDRFILANLTHDYPEWKRYKHLFIPNMLTKREDILIEDMFDDPNIKNSEYIRAYLKEDPFADDKEFLQIMKEEYLHPELCY